MSKYLLDTNVVIHYFSGGRPGVAEAVSKCLPDISLCSITLAELYSGLAALDKSIEPLDELIEALGGQPEVLDFDFQATQKYLALQRKLHNPSGRGPKRKFSLEEVRQLRIKRCDHFIAAIAKANNMILVTENMRDFEPFRGYLPLISESDWVDRVNR